MGSPRSCESNPVSQPDPQKDGRLHWTFISVALFVIGLLILVPSGLCTAFGGILTIIEGDPSSVLLVLLFGGLPMAVGALLVWAGLKARSRD